MGLINSLTIIKILKDIVVPFKNTEAYKAGVIDQNGKVLKKGVLQKYELFIINLKKIIAKIPGGGSLFGSMAAASLLLKEQKFYTEEDLIQEINYLKSRMALPTLDGLRNIILEDMAIPPINNIGSGNISNPLNQRLGKILRRPKVKATKEG